MMNRTTALAILLGLLAPATGAAAQACATLDRIVTAADATPTWLGVTNGSRGTALPAGFSACTTTDYSSSTDYNCTADATAATVETIYAALVRQLEQCLQGELQVRTDDISTSTRWSTPSGVQITATRVAQVNANNFGVGLTVRRSF